MNIIPKSQLSQRQGTEDLLDAVVGKDGFTSGCKINNMIGWKVSRVGTKIYQRVFGKKRNVAQRIGL